MRTCIVCVLTIALILFACFATLGYITKRCDTALASLEAACRLSGEGDYEGGLAEIEAAQSEIEGVRLLMSITYPHRFYDAMISALAQAEAAAKTEDNDGFQTAAAEARCAIRHAADYDRPSFGNIF